MWEKNCFVTLTYNDENLPEDGSIDKKEMQRFMKYLRRDFGGNIRFFGCGEYGENYGRPHYHLCLFNHDFPDKYQIVYDGPKGRFSTYKQEVKLYRSGYLESIWKKGFSSIGEVNFETAAYVARYCTKKFKGEGKEEFYGDLEPEFALMSRKPGIGKFWWEKYKTDVLNTDKVILRNDLRLMPPRYYDNIVEQKMPEKYKKIKRRRKACFKEIPTDRLAVKEELKLLNAKKLKRRIECHLV